MIKLLAVDMDGTCLDSNSKMSDETYNALKKAAESGVIVVPTTGRSIKSLPQKIKDDDFYQYVISSNGALVTDLKNNNTIFKANINSQTAYEILKKCKRHLIFISGHINRDYYVQGKIVYKGVRHYLGDDAQNLIVVRNMAKAILKGKLEAEVIQLYYRGKKYPDIINKIVASYEDISAVHFKNYTEIVNKNSSKGDAVLHLAKHLGITADEIACIGDQENDISMFEVAGNRFAMGNAIDKLKALATAVLPTNNENGVAEAIYKYILK